MFDRYLYGWGQVVLVLAGLGCAARVPPGESWSPRGNAAISEGVPSSVALASSAASDAPVIIIDRLGAPAGQSASAVPLWAPPPRVAARAGYVDLSPRLPAIGRQIINDCVAWASAYYLRSYLWAHSSGMPATSIDRVFSPTFVYNQINGGRDEGAYLVAALNVLKEGVPPLRTAPYHTRYTESPSQAQRLAAKEHTVRSYARVDSRAEIAAALYSGLPVLVHVITDQEFNSGRHPVYNASLRARSADARAHGHHVMLVVGLDPDPAACRFKLVNSWGIGWGQRGFTWVDCGLFDKIQPDGGETFLQEAYVITGWSDHGRTEALPQPTVDPGAFALQQSDLSGATVAKGDRRRWHLTLTSSDRALSLRSPELDAAGCRRYPTRYECELGEEMSGKVIEVRVKNCAGRCRDMSTQRVTVALGDFKPRTGIRLANQALLLKGSTTAGHQNFNWTVFIEASEDELRNIERVKYRLHRTFPRRVVKVTESREAGFPLSAVGYGEFRIRANIKFKSGRKRLKHCLQLGFDTSVCGEKKGG